jgi:hypothetical protein
VGRGRGGPPGGGWVGAFLAAAAGDVDPAWSRAWKLYSRLVSRKRNFTAMWIDFRGEQLIWDGFLKKKLLWDGNDLFSVLFPMKSVVFKINSLTLSKAKGENFDVLLQVIRAG